MKKYFLKDESLSSIDGDFFRHQDVANNIREIIENTEAPFSIAVIGKWGLGKSSLINMVISALAKEKDRYQILKINAWKYEKENLSRAFAQTLWEQLTGKRVVTYRMLQNDFLTALKEIFVQEPEENGGKKKTLCQRTKGFLRTFNVEYGVIILVWLLLSFIAYAVYKYLQVHYIYPETMGIEYPLVLVITGYCKNIGTLLLAPMLLLILGQMFGNIKNKVPQNFDLNLMTDNVEDYEVLLQDAIEKKVSEDNKDLRFVVIIDDLDRLSMPKMMEALDTIKFFVDLEHCIFIIPFDDEIIKAAIKEERTQSLTKASGFEIQSESILDKLFQYKVYLPQVITYHIKNYAVELCNRELTDFIREYCDKEIFDNIIRNILIYPEVETPRQVKKLINSFVSNVMIARGRENAGKVSREMSTTEAGLRIIAKLAVLQADFNSFYDILFVCNDAMDYVVQASSKEGMTLEELPQELRIYFELDKRAEETEDGTIEFSRKYQSLVNFIIRTDKYKTDNLLAYLYMVQDDISIKIGDRLQQSFLNFAKSLNFKKCKELLEEKPELFEAAERVVSQKDDWEDNANIIVSLINCQDTIDGAYKTRFGVCLEQVLPQLLRMNVDFNSSVVDFEQLLKLYLETGKLEGERNLLLYYLNNPDKEKMALMCRIYVKYFPELLHAQDIVTQLKACLRKLLEEKADDPDEVISVYSDTDAQYIKELWDDKFFSYMVEYSIESGSKDEGILSAVVRGFNDIVNEDNATKLFRQLSSVYRSTAYAAGVFNHILTPEVCNWLDLETRNEFAVSIVQITDMDDVVNALLCKVEYGKIEDESVQYFDEYFEKQIKNEVFGELLKGFAEHNSLEQVPNSIEHLFESLIEDPDSGYSDDFSKIAGKLSKVQGENLVSLLKPQMCYASGKKYVNLDKVIKIMLRHENLNSYMSELVSCVSSNVSGATVTYVSFANQCMTAMKEYVEPKTLSLYLKNLIGGRVSVGTDVTYALCAMCDIYTKENFIMVEKVLLKSIGDSNADEIVHVIHEYAEWINQEDRAEVWDLFVEAMTNAVAYSRTPNIALELLQSKVETISVTELISLYEKINANEKVNRDTGDAIIAEYLDAMEETAALDSFLKLWKMENGTETITRLIPLLKKNTLHNLVAVICEDSSTCSNEQIKIVFEITIQVKGHLEDIARLAKILSNKEKTEDQYFYVFNKIKYVSGMKSWDKKEKHVITDVESILFRKSTSGKLRKDIVDHVRKMRMGKYMSGKLEGYEDELKVFKEILKS